MRTNHSIQLLIAQNNKKTYHKITINTLTNRSVTHLEEAPSISSDILLERESKTYNIQFLVDY